MEVRCGKCNKLFRVSDDKITGRGVKFSCTRCGESVKITREAFEEYSLAQSAVPAPDMFKPKAIPAVEPAPETEPTAATGEAAGFAEAASEEPKPTEPSSPAVPDFLQEREEPPIPLPNPFEETSPLTEQSPLEEPPAPPSPLPEEMGTEPVKAPEVAIELEPRSEPVMEAEPEQESVPEPAAESKLETAVDKGPDAGLVAVPVPDGVTLETPAVTNGETGPAVVAIPAAAAVSATARVSGQEKAAPRKEPVHAAVTMTPKPVIRTVASQPVRSGRMVPLILVAAIILVLSGFGAYLYVRPSPPPAVHEAGPVMVSTEGLQIINPTGSLDANGDLLVSGVLENQTDQERANWYIVVDVYDAQGKALSAIGMLNGRQIYTKRDYELLAKRGTNVQELKELARQPRGVVLPPKGRTPFEIRYLQPPDGIASFNASLQPFDPARLQKEIEAEAR